MQTFFSWDQGRFYFSPRLLVLGEEATSAYAFSEINRLISSNLASVRSYLLKGMKLSKNMSAGNTQKTSLIPRATLSGW
jgi:hypothetical protein